MCGPGAPWTPPQGGCPTLPPLGGCCVTVHDPSPAHAGGSCLPCQGVSPTALSSEVRGSHSSGSAVGGSGGGGAARGGPPPRCRPTMRSHPKRGEATAAAEPAAAGAPPPPPPLPVPPCGWRPAAAAASRVPARRQSRRLPTRCCFRCCLCVWRAARPTHGAPPPARAPPKTRTRGPDAEDGASDDESDVRRCVGSDHRTRRSGLAAATAVPRPVGPSTRSQPPPPPSAAAEAAAATALACRRHTRAQAAGRRGRSGRASPTPLGGEPSRRMRAA